MSKLQDTLDSLQPYVIGIRYIEGHVMVDCILKEGWVIPESNNGVQKLSNKDLDFYYTLFSENKSVGLDDILSYVQEIILINQEREDKKALLISLVEELKKIFKENKLSRLKNLKFTYSDDKAIDEIGDINMNDVIGPEDVAIPPVEDLTPEVFQEEQPPIDEGELSEEEREILEEERRAAAYFSRKETNDTNNKVKQAVSQQAQKVELPPRAAGVNMLCDCDENQACSKCMDEKGY